MADDQEAVTEAKAGDRLAVDSVKAHLRRREVAILEALRDAGASAIGFRGTTDTKARSCRVAA